MRSRRRGLPALLLGFCLVLAAAPTAIAEDGFVVLVNHTNPVASFRRTELRRSVLGGAKQWENGAIVQIGLIPNDAPETRYFASLLDLSVTDFFTRIQEQVFKGEMRRPVVLRSSADCVAFASSNAGALCVASDREPLPPEAKAVPIH